MILDKDDELASGQNLTASGASTNHKNLRLAARHIGIGEPMAVLITLPSEPDETTGDETYVAKLQVDDNNAFSSPTDLAFTVTIPRTAKVTDRFVIPIPPDTSMEKFLRAYLTLGGTTPSITFNAHIVAQRSIQGDAYYPDAVDIA
jgi:hypothetical protein